MIGYLIITACVWFAIVGFVNWFKHSFLRNDMEYSNIVERLRSERNRLAKENNALIEENLFLAKKIDKLEYLLGAPYRKSAR